VRGLGARWLVNITQGCLALIKKAELLAGSARLSASMVGYSVLGARRPYRSPQG
jgi:hypothetical protein